MADILSQLNRGSYKSIPMLVSSSEVRTGRKTTSHEYPLSDRREIEDLGKFPVIIKIQFIVSDAFGDYFSERKKMISALNEGKIGKLIDPWNGEFNVRLLEPIVFDDAITKIGITTFSVTFGETSKLDNPKKAVNSPTQVNSLSGIYDTSVEVDFA